MTIGGAVTAFSLALIFSTGADAQGQPEAFTDYSHPNITIDLSVIGDGGYRATVNSPAPMFAAPAERKLLMPGSQAPSSMLHVPTASGAPLPKLEIPKKVQTVAKAPAPITKKAPVAAPVVAKAPEIKAASAPAVVPPAKPAPVAKAKPKAPPPASMVEPTPKVAKTEAPKAPEAPPAPEAKEAPANLQASLQPADAQSESGSLRVAFPADQTKLPAAAKDRLMALAEKMKGQDNMRLQLMAYAGGSSLSSSLARRMSLSRALSVRSFLIENGVRSTRIDVRALGNKTTEEPVNRVDLNVAER
ncbi:MAG: OmpA family protein [Rhodospirillales bacterium]|nr:OmpA family protein [Rhodospirillales bacterium]